MKVFRYKTRRTSYILCGRTLAGIQDLFLDVTDVDVAPVCDGYYCVIYDDTPLLTDEFLDELAKECEALDVCYRLGDGYITKKGYSGSYKKCENMLAFQVKDLRDLPFVESFLREYKINEISKKNVFLMDKNTTYIDLDVEIGEGSVVYPMTSLRGKTKIGNNCAIYPYCDIVDTVVGDGTTICSSCLDGAIIGKNVSVGPFAYLRAGAIVGDNCRIGDFVEVKNSVLADGVKAAHLAYVGDSEVGEKTNVGCGAVFANYDGVKKSRCKVGKNAFIGANVNLVAPVDIGDGAYIAAGSTVTEDVPDSSLCIARSRQVFKKKR